MNKGISTTALLMFILSTATTSSNQKISILSAATLRVFHRTLPIRGKTLSTDPALGFVVTSIVCNGIIVSLWFHFHCCLWKGYPEEGCIGDIFVSAAIYLTKNGY